MYLPSKLTSNALSDISRAHHGVTSHVAPLPWTSRPVTSLCNALSLDTGWNHRPFSNQQVTGKVIGLTQLDGNDPETFPSITFPGLFLWSLLLASVVAADCQEVSKPKGQGHTQGRNHTWLGMWECLFSWKCLSSNLWMEVSHSKGPYEIWSRNWKTSYGDMGKSQIIFLYFSPALFII